MTGDLAAHPGLAGGPVYLDYNATTPVDPRVAEAMAPHLRDLFGNPSSSHLYSAAPRMALAAARGQVAALIGARPHEIVFTASGSEADLLAVRGAAIASGRPRPHVITQVTEHPAVLQTCHALERLHGARVTMLPVDGEGLVDPAALDAALTDPSRCGCGRKTPRPPPSPPSWPPTRALAGSTTRAWPPVRPNGW
ncbi:aminotransferase class V-fold PLP-dependent enzyme [Streptosporangium sp. NPDC002544]|uniref:aminotransferase class V-fold PLP-dependent enzyme n=1 Tax=Streptosporangium sp. NPDC002544 TaxID=3154538 RepID=UPI0033286E9A